MCCAIGAQGTKSAQVVGAEERDKRTSSKDMISMSLKKYKKWTHLGWARCESTHGYYMMEGWLLQAPSHKSITQGALNGFA